MKQTVRISVLMVVVMVAGLMLSGSAMATSLNRLLLADDSSKKILVYDRDLRVYTNEFADASGLLPGADIVALAANDAGTKVYVAVSIVVNSNADDSRIYMYDVAESGGVLTGTNPTLLYQHTLGGWGSRRSMCIGPDANGDGAQDVYFTVPSPGWNNETVYWVDGATGGAATSYQNIGTQHNRHLEFKSDDSLGWGVWLNSMSEAQTYNSALVSHYNDIGTLKTGGNALMTGPDWWETLTDNSMWRMKDMLFDADDVLYYSSYHAQNGNYYQRLYQATKDSGTGYWTPAAFTGGGLGDSTTSTGLRPGVMTLLTVTPPPPPAGTVVSIR